MGGTGLYDFEQEFASIDSTSRLKRALYDFRRTWPFHPWKVGDIRSVIWRQGADDRRVAPQRDPQLFGMFRRKPPIRDARELSDFIDENAAFLAQKGIYEYSSAWAGHYAKVLFAEKTFSKGVEESCWRAYPLGLAVVTEMTEGVLRPYAVSLCNIHDELTKRTDARAIVDSLNAGVC